MTGFWTLTVYSSVTFVVFMIISSLYRKNLFWFIFFSAWFVIYSAQQIILFHDLQAESPVNYLNSTIDMDGFKLASIVYLFLTASFLLLNVRPPVRRVQLDGYFYVGFKSKLLYLLFFVTVAALLLRTIGGVDDLIYSSRPANVTGATAFLYLLMSVKVLLFATHNGKFDAFFLMLFIFLLLILALTSRVHFILSLCTFLIFVWVVNLREGGRTGFGFKLLTILCMLPVFFLFMGVIKFSDSSMNSVLADGIAFYIYQRFDGLSQFVLLLYKINVESFSNLASFLTRYHFDFIPNFFFPSLQVIFGLFPGAMRDVFFEVRDSISSFSRVDGNVPSIFTQFLDAFHLIAIPFFLLFLRWFNSILMMAFVASGYKFLLSIIILGHALMLVRGTAELMIAGVVYEFFGLMILYVLGRHVKVSRRL